jgi:uncharacterized membrane protein YedE/YeeE
MTMSCAASFTFAQAVANKPAWWAAVVVLAAVGVYFALRAKRSWEEMPRSGEGRAAERYDFLRYCFGAFCAAGAILLGIGYHTGAHLRNILILVAVPYLVGLGAIWVYGARLSARQRHVRKVR